MGSFFDNAQADTMVTNLDVTTSSRTTYSTSNPAVALVDDVGRIIAAGPGATTVRIQYGSIGATVPITVKDSPFGDLNGDGKVDQDDLNILQFAIGLVAVGPRDARDRNRNGVIDALDAQDLARTCANSGCRLSFAPFSLFHIERARMKRNNDRAGDDQLEIRGDFRVSRTRDGIDVLKDGVTLMLGSLRRVFSGTSFVRHADDEGRFRVKDPSNGNWRIRIGDDGKFRVEAEKLDLRSINFGQPVLFSLQVGNDLGATEVQFEMKEINHAGRD